jgi:hypothetical protein
MASQLEIANWALMLLGEKRISSLSDNNANAENIASGWDMLRDRALRRQAWHFAIERASLAADSATPVWGFDYQYSFGAGVLRPIQISEYYVGVDLSDYRNTDSAPFRIEKRKILTNLGAPLKVKWIVNTTDIGDWDPNFAAAFAADIADFIQPRAVQSDSTSQRIAAWRYEALSEANALNAIEDPPEPLADDTFIAAHNG